MVVLAISVRPGNHVSVQFSLSHDALPKGPPTAATAVAQSSLVPDVLARSGREAGSLPLPRSKCHLALLVSSTRDTYTG